MKYKITQLLLLVTILIIVASCKDNNPVLPDYKRIQSDVIKPLAIGNYWKYKVTYLDYPNTPSENYSLETIIGDTTFNNLKYYILQNKFDRLQPFFLSNILNYYQINFCLNNSNGFLNRTKYQNEEIIKFPANVGDEFSLTNSNEFIAKVIAKNEIVTVEAGKFVCYHYQANDWAYRIAENGMVLGRGNYRIDLYYTVGVGLILEIWTPEGGVNEQMPFIRKELVEYEVK